MNTSTMTLKGSQFLINGNSANNIFTPESFSVKVGIVKDIRERNAEALLDTGEYCF